MDNEFNHQQRRHRNRQGWQFTYLGETPETLDKTGNREALAPDFADDPLSMTQVFPLSTTQAGDHVVITQIMGGKNLEYRLSQMGFTLGAEVQVISKTSSGSIIVCIQNKQVGLGAGMANQVMVSFAAEK